MRLQLALDELSIGEAVEIVAELHDLVDIVEIGTPLIIKEGLAAVTTMKKRFADTTILADLKIMDGGNYESQIAFESGADIVSVLALAHDVTIEAAVRQALQHKRAIMIDLIGSHDTVAGVLRAQRLGADWVCVHTAADLSGKTSLDSQEVQRAISAASGCQVAVAGGITLQTVGGLAIHNPDALVIGNAIVKSRDPRHAAFRVRQEVSKARRTVE